MIWLQIHEIYVLFGVLHEALHLCLGQELIYVWNGFMIIGKKPELIEPILAFVEETINDIMSHKGLFYQF